MQVKKKNQEVITWLSIVELGIQIQMVIFSILPMDCLAQLEVEALTDVGVGWTELRTLLDQIEIVLIETSALKLFMVANLRYQLS